VLYLYPYASLEGHGEGFFGIIPVFWLVLYVHSSASLGCCCEVFFKPYAFRGVDLSFGQVAGVLAYCPASAVPAA